MSKGSSGGTEDLPDYIATDMTSQFTIDKVFEMHEEATTHIKKLGKSLGVVIVILRSDLTGKRTPYITFQCEKGGMPRDHRKGGKYQKTDGTLGKNKPRESSTRKCGWPFLVKCCNDMDKGTWFFQVLNGVHNHKVLQFAEGRAYLGRLDKEDVACVYRMTKNGILPKYILRELRSKDPENCTQPKTIYNIRSKLKRQAREGRSVMQEILHLADRSNSFIHYREESNVLKDIFWAHSDSLSLSRCFPSVMLMDCTYKTNRYKMPLLQIVGVTSKDMSFSVGFALLGFEREDNYTWALNMLRDALGDQSQHVRCIVTDRKKPLMNAIHVVFPDAKNLICRWHIEKGLVSNLKTKTTSEEWKVLMKRWNEVVSSSTDKDFIDRLEECKQIFNEDAMTYITSTWLDTHKERFVAAWTDSIFHLGNTSTSRVEGMHSVFKNWLKSGVGDLVTEWHAGVNMIEQKVRNVKGSFEKSLFLDPKRYKDEPLFKELKHNVSITALHLLSGEVMLCGVATTSQSDCGCYIRKTHGLPCSHEIAKYMKKPGFIPLSAVHAHWKTLYMEGPPPTESQLDHKPVMHAIEEKLRYASDWEKQRMIIKMREICQPMNTSVGEPPIKLTGRGRPKGSQNKRKKSHEESTKRNPSLFERVENLIIDIDDKLKPRKSTTRRKRVQVSHEASQRVDSFIRRYLTYMPTQVHEHVLSVCNVAPDGTCGFRVIALAVGLREDDWPTVRKAIKNEMVLNKPHYLTMLVHDVLYDTCIEHADHEKGPCGPSKYYDSFMSWVVCNIYDAVLTILSPSSNCCQTFLPSIKQPPARPPTHIWMVHCNGDHFVSAEMKDSCPMPRMPIVWNDARLSEASPWLEQLQYRMSMGRAL